MPLPIGLPADMKEFANLHWWRMALTVIASAALLSTGNAQAQDAACRYVKLATLPVVFNNYRPTVVGAVNDKSAVMLVDTGSFATALTMPGATDHGLNVRHRLGSGNVMGVNGESDLLSARIESLSVGGINGQRQDIPVIGQMQGSEPIDALVGANFLFQADVEFNLSKPEISFFQPIGCGKAFLAYWSSDAYFIETKRLGSGNRQPVFTVQVNGHDVDAIIDSGAATSVIDIHAAAAAGVTTESPGVIRVGMSAGIGGNPVPSYLGSFDTVTVGAETLRKAKLFITDLTGGYQGSADAAVFGPKLLLGADFLKAHRVLFAVSQSRIYISYVGGEVFVGDHYKPPSKSAAALEQGASSSLDAADASSPSEQNQK